MDYSKFDYDQLVEAIATMDKDAFPENYDSLQSSIDNYPAEKRKKQEITKNIRSLSIGQLNQKLAATEDPIAIELINQKITYLLWLKKKRLIWLKWIPAGIIALIIGLAMPGDLKQIALPIGLITLIGCLVMAFRANRHYKKEHPVPQ